MDSSILTEFRNVLITGGAGFLGSFLAEKLVREGASSLRIFDNLWRGNLRNLRGLPAGVEIVNGDVRDYSQVRAAVKGVDTIFHLASIQGTRFFYEKPELVLDVGILGCLNVAKASKESKKVKKIVYASSSEVYGDPKIFPTPEDHELSIPDPTNPRWSYAATKILGEVIFLNYSRVAEYETTIIRIHNAFGPRMGWEHVIPEFCRRLVLREKFTMEGSGEETRSFCYVDDIVKGLVLSARKDFGTSQIFNIGNDKAEVRIRELAEALARIAGSEISPTLMPLKGGSTKRRKPDITKARRLLGYEPEVSLDEGLRETYEWFSHEIEWWTANSSPSEYPWNDEEKRKAN